MLKSTKLVLPAVLALLLLGISLAAGCGVLLQPVAPTPTLAPAAPGSLPPDFDKLWQVWHVLQNGYIDKQALDSSKLSEGAIKGMLDALGDPYTAYMDATHYQSWTTTFHGNYEGIGVEISKQGEHIVVVTTYEGSPAQKAGIRASDMILEVNGESTIGMSTLDLSARVKGPKGTAVRLLILHSGEDSPVTMEIVRDSIELVSASYKKMNDLGYIRLNRFAENTDKELQPLLRQARQDGVRGLILDLRGNPGGYLDVTVSIASQFLKSGIVYSQMNSDGSKTSEPVKPGGLATDLPLAVLVNKGSASGSEVLSGALQDYGRATLIGTTTFGKGSANTIASIDGGALYYTIARWLTPNGRLIEGKGLTPDISVERTDEDIKQGRDPQLDRAAEYLHSQIKAPATS